MHPTSELLPVAVLLKGVPEGWDDLTGRRAHMAVGVPAIPDMTRVVRFVPSAIETALDETLR